MQEADTHRITEETAEVVSSLLHSVLFNLLYITCSSNTAVRVVVAFRDSSIFFIELACLHCLPPQKPLCRVISISLLFNNMIEIFYYALHYLWVNGVKILVRLKFNHLGLRQPRCLPS